VRYDRLRRVLVVLVAGLIFLPAALFPQQTSSQERSVRLSLVSGAVTVKPPGTAEGVPAKEMESIKEGFEVSTSSKSRATVQLENGSTIQLSELSKAIFTSLSADPKGNRLSIVTLEQGIADFSFKSRRNDSYQIKIEDATLTPDGNTVFQATFISNLIRAHVISGSVSCSAPSNFMTLGKGMTMDYNPLTAEEIAKSHVRVVRVSYVSGTLTMKRPSSQEWENATVNTPLQEGFELSTSGSSYAEVEFENGSTARLGELSKLKFNQLGLNADGGKLNGMTFEQGYGTFNFLPERRDTYHVKIGDATLAANGKCEFRTDIDRGHFRLEVFSGSVDVATPTLSVKLGGGKVLERQSGSTELAFNIRKGIDKDGWDKWTEARDRQAQLAWKEQSLGPGGTRYGISELDAYGEWAAIPGRGYGWSPYARAGWSPYTSGMWSMYPGFGWTWISNEPWGWLPYHCGLWDFDDSFGWFWMMPGDGCQLWQPSLVDWYTGPGWIGWAPQTRYHPGGPHPPSGRPGSGQPQLGQPTPGRPTLSRPGSGPRVGNPLTAMRAVTTVPVGVVQNRQMITPEIVKSLVAGPDNRIQHPAFEPAPRPAFAATAPAAGSPSSSNTRTVTAAPGLAPPMGPGMGYAPRHSSAPSTVLMGGDPRRDDALLSGRHVHSGGQPMRVHDGATLGGRYGVGGSPGELRGEGFRGGRDSGAGVARGSQGGPTVTHSSGGAGAMVVPRGGGGPSHGGSGHGWSGGSSGGGGHSGGGYSGGGSHASGSSASAGGGHAGGGGGSAGGGGGASAGSGGGGASAGGGAGASAGGGGGGASAGGGAHR
jgi:hypothetical protein